MGGGIGREGVSGRASSEKCRRDAGAPSRVGAAILIALSWLLLAAGPRPGGQPLAEVAGEVITVDDFHAEMMRRGGHLPGQYATVEQRRELLEAMIDHRALVAAARAAGYDRDPEVVAIFERAMVERFRQDRLDPESAAAEVSDQEVARLSPTKHAAATRAR